MSELAVAFKREFSNLPAEIAQRWRDNRIAEIEDARSIERENNIAVAAMAMIDAGLSDETVTQMLQKHWDLRRSETVPFLRWAHSQLENR